jgi:formylglycine-generating enzyme required for sulfatase activity/dienelactone hydrolase
VETGFAILNDEPAPVPGLPPDLDRILRRCLRKEPADRYPTAQALLEDLERAAAALKPRPRHRPLVVSAVAALAALGAASAAFLFVRESRNRKARDAIPRISSLIERNDLSAAFALGREVEQVLPGDPLLAKMWPDMSRIASIRTEPPGADISVRAYDREEAPFLHLGRSPLLSARIPLPHLLWRITRDGFEPLEVAPSYSEGEPRPTNLAGAGNLFFALQKPGTVPEGMVRVRGGEVRTTIDGLATPAAATIPDYFLDRYEVTNKEFKKFVDAGGYRSRQYWREAFAEAGHALSWEEATARFRDRSGTPGPASWTSGEYPEGEADLPVTGVSWYEAAAYAVFAAKSLPTVYHWDHAAGVWAAGWTVPASNFGAVRPVRVGSLPGTGPYGTKDMAGNAKEWCWNADGDKRYLLGGSFDEPGYMFGDADAQSAFDRSPRNGFRLAKYLDEDLIPKDLFAPQTLVGWRDYASETPVPEATFRIYRGLYAYDRGDLRAAVESTDDGADSYRRQRVTVGAAYGNERLPIIVFTPKGHAPPYQTVLYFPSSGALVQRSSQYLTDLRLITFLTRTGRAVVYPIYKSTYERGDDFAGRMHASASVRDHVLQWVKDARRAIDYVESRNDLDARKIAFIGLSWGADVAPIVLAVEDRLKLGIFIAGGLPRERLLPEVDPIHFAPHVRQPVLMINGRYDWMDPLELSQLPLFRLLGSPGDGKRHFVAEGGHGPAPEVVYKETQAWLDRHLGPVR